MKIRLGNENFTYFTNSVRLSLSWWSKFVFDAVSPKNYIKGIREKEVLMSTRILHN